MSRLTRNSHGFSLIEIMIALGISGVLAIFGVQIFQNINQLVFNSANEAELTSGRTIISKILNNTANCSENLKGLAPNEAFKRLAIKNTADPKRVSDVTVLEVGRTVDLSSEAGPSKKYYLNDMKLNNFYQYGSPIDKTVASEKVTQHQGVLEVQFTYAADRDGTEGSKRLFSESYNVLAKYDPKTKKITECIGSFEYPQKEFCTKSLRGFMDDKDGFCHNLYTDEQPDPSKPSSPFSSGSITLKPAALNNLGLDSQDGMIIGSVPDTVSIGGSFAAYSQMFLYSANFNTYNNDGSVKKVERQESIYYKATYTKVSKKENPMGYRYELVEKRKIVVDPNGSPKISWVPRDPDSTINAGYWKWQSWNKAETNNNKANWLYEKNPSMSHPLKYGVPAHNAIVKLFSVEGGTIMTNTIGKYIDPLKPKNTPLPPPTISVVSEETFDASSYSYYSDKKLKQNVKPLANKNAILNLNTYQYDFIHSEGPSSFGFMADEVRVHFPEAVTTGADGYDKVDYFSLVAPILEKLKAQDEQLKNLRKELKQLEESL